VPAELSSPIPSGLDPLCDADPLQEAETPHLLAYLASVPDPRAPRGRRHPLIAIVAVAAAAVLAGACSMTAIAEWAAEAPQPVRAALGDPGEVPAFQPLLDGLDLAGAIITADALFRDPYNASYAEVPVMPRWWAVALLLGVTVPGRSA
jgi:DDE_Tnp_1-associated